MSKNLKIANCNGFIGRPFLFQYSGLFSLKCVSMFQESEACLEPCQTSMIIPFYNNS